MKKNNWITYGAIALGIYFLTRKNKSVSGIGAVLREVKVYFANGDIIHTNMAAHLTDSEIKNYYRIGSYFNLGNGEHDSMQQITKVEILK